jgi:hypothetical protein
MLTTNCAYAVWILSFYTKSYHGFMLNLIGPLLLPVRNKFVKPTQRYAIRDDPSSLLLLPPLNLFYIPWISSDGGRLGEEEGGL